MTPHRRRGPRRPRALNHRCPTCKVQPGTWCITLNVSVTTIVYAEFLHDTRINLTGRWPKPPKEILQ